MSSIDSVTKALLRRDVFSVKAGSIVVEMPPLQPEELQDVLAFFALVTARIQREFGPVAEASLEAREG